MPTVLITGGTGLIGKNLTSHLTNRGYGIIILTRKPFTGKIQQRYNLCCMGCRKTAN